MKTILLAVLLGMTVTATAQRIGGNDVQELRMRLQNLQLTIEQKRRIMNLMRRERLQYYLNQRELNQILTEKQKAMLLQWRRMRQANQSDSTKSIEKP